MNINIKSGSGLIRMEFEDHLGNDCIAQVYESTEHSKWLRIGIVSTFDNQDSTPMCLSKEDITLLLPILQHFAKYEDLPFGFLNE